MSKENPVLKKIGQAIEPVIARMLAATSEKELQAIADGDLHKVLSDFTKYPATRTAVVKVKAVRKARVVAKAETMTSVRFAAYLVAVGLGDSPRPPRSQAGDANDCDQWYDLYNQLVALYLEQFDSWDECTSGGATSPNPAALQTLGSGDVAPGVPDILLGQSTLGRCGGLWDAMAETGQELESMEFAMRSAGCL